MILDVGCGSYKRGGIGVDIRQDSEADIICDGHHLPFRDSVFTGVISINFLEHCLNPFQALSEQTRVSKGMVFMVTDNASYVKFHLNSMYHPKVGIGHTCIFYPENILDMYKLLGLKIVCVDFLGIDNLWCRLSTYFGLFRHFVHRRFYVWGCKT